MTRAEVLAAYTVNERGIITSPGKFELAPAFVPALWEVVLDGFAAEEDEEGHSIIEVTREDKAEFPELGTMEHIGLWEEESGFVRWWDATEYLSLTAKGQAAVAAYGPTREECEKLAAEHNND